MRLLQLAPRLPPPHDGVGGYAAALAGELAAHHGIATRFFSAEPSAGASTLEREPRALAAQLAAVPEATTVLLHYANYGFARRGCPGWLVAGLERWLAARPRHRLLSFFHEVYATGRPWQSSFWLGPRQRRLARRLAAASTLCATSLELYAGLLRRLEPRCRPQVLPVFSTVGEPAAVPGFGKRPPRLVVFGGRGARERAFGPCRDELAAACLALGLAEIVDLGPPLTTLPGHLGALPVRGLGELPAAEVSRQLLAARAGFLAYPRAFLGKSTIYAAYAAHGLLPLVAGEAGVASRSAPALPSAEAGAAAGVDAAGIAAAAHAWYAEHALGRQAARCAEWLQG